MTMPQATRGTGLLENWLARRRAARAQKLLRGADETGAVLDVGCGRYPLFLIKCEFMGRVGIDARFSKEVKAACRREGVELLEGLMLGEDLPFDEETFAAVVMLAVFEHMPLPLLPGIIKELRRVLRADGVLVLTTPTRLGDKVLRILARLGLVSKEEIDEHAHALAMTVIRQLLIEAGFAADRIRSGRFELGMNRWVRVS